MSTSSPVERSANDEGASFPVVALGASAGGLAALTAFLTDVAVDTGMAFVVIQHLDPHHDSLLVGLLAKATAMEVVQVTDGMMLVPNRVHVIPPDSSLTVAGDRIGLLPRDESRPPMPIDKFLRALAEERECDAVAVILSGTGSDGTAGIEAVRAHGGVTLAQDPDEAAFDGMPRSAIATGCVDVVLPVARLGSEIARIIVGAAVPDGRARPSDDRADGESVHRDVMSLLHVQTGVDFSQYRQTTVRRRLRRRLAMSRAPDLGAYLEHLHENPGEIQDLAQDLLIHVTRFFRDAKAFDVLEGTVFPDLIRHAGRDGLVRMWVPGCSTGEEAYSLAMAFVETATRMGSGVTCQVFATDINETVLDKARRATYGDAITPDVSAERLARFFARAHGEYRVGRELRDLCVFSRHDLLNDPPLSRMRFVSCRNLLIYLDTMQRRALTALHFALEPRGYLLLGQSETAASQPALFDLFDREAHIYRTRASIGGRVPPSGAATGEPPSASPALRPEGLADATAYEELVAANQELQSLNEELESSKEEIESSSQELRTLNDELSSRNSALRLAQEYAQATLDTVRSALIVLDAAHVVVSANRSFYKAFHLTTADVERRPIAEVAPEYFGAPGITRLIAQAATSGVGLEDVEVECDLPERGRRVLLVNIRRFAPSNLFLLSVDDVTQLRQVEADRRQSQKMEAIGHLAAGVAHDFNNLLTVVLAGAQLATDTLPADSPTRQVLASVDAAARRAADLTRQLLAYAGKARVYVERVALSDIVVQTASLLHASIPPHVQLRLDLAKDLPRLLADPSQMHQVVDNLVTNAIEAVGASPGEVLVRTGWHEVTRADLAGVEPGSTLTAGAHVYVEVHDTGVGMSESTQRQMFDPFFTTKFTGRGLGLAAVQGIVRQHHGTISVHSIAGRGTTIRVLFAVTPVPAVPAAAVETAALRHGTEVVLVVDDEPLVLELSRRVLAAFGYTVVTASGGHQALDLIEATPKIAVVVLDSTMPGMDGLATLEAIRRLRPELPVLVCSGLGDASLEATFAAHGVTGFVHKPFSIGTLVQQVGACLTPAD